MKNEFGNKIKDGNYIVNLESSPSIGSHWTALIIRDDQAFYFDSYGAFPSMEIVKYVKKRKGIKFAFNNWIIQDLHSENCGSYCIALLLFLKLKKEHDLFDGVNEYINMFVDNTKQNDVILREYFKSISGDKPEKILRLLRQKS